MSTYTIKFTSDPFDDIVNANIHDADDARIAYLEISNDATNSLCVETEFEPENFPIAETNTIDMTIAILQRLKRAYDDDSFTADDVITFEL